jgi:peptide chain release factor 1
MEEFELELTESILPKNSVDTKNCTIEIASAAGGSESSLFAEDLVNMYK